MRQFLIVTDIFGQCHGLQQLLSALAAPARQFTVLDPYQGGMQQNFSSEQQAYAAYTIQCGHEQYAKLVAGHLSSSQKPISLAIGFSAGATALWRALADESCSNKPQQAVLFYPGQIYKHLDLVPKIPVKVIFGASEPHFTVAELCLVLAQKPKVEAVVTPYGHGFMNPASLAFNAQGFADYALTCKLTAESSR
ncbi:hypothetical protein [Alishewanella longhuensis]